MVKFMIKCMIKFMIKFMIVVAKREQGHRARSVQLPVLACELQEVGELLHHGGWSFLP